MSKTMIITAGSGIGASTAKAFLSAGWNVDLIGRRKEPLAAVSVSLPHILFISLF